MEYKDNLLGVVQTIFKWKKIIILTCVATALGAIVTVMLLPVYYKSTTTFFAASPDLATPEAIFGKSGTAPDYYGTGNDTERLMSIANSGDLVNHMIERFNLYERYEIDPDHPLGPYTIRLKFNKHYQVVKTKYDAIELSVEDTDKAMAAQMANAGREYIAATAQGLIKESQAKLLTIFEKNLTEKQAQIDSLQENLEHVRKKYSIFNTSAQSEGLSELMAKAESKLYNSTAKLEVLQSGGGFRDSIRYLQAAIKGYQNEIAQLSVRLDTFNQGMAKVDFLSKTNFELTEVMAEDQQHFKQIKAAYDTDFPTVMLLEAAPVPLIKSRPKRTLIVVAATFAAFVFSVIGVLVFDTYKDVDWRKVLQI